MLNNKDIQNELRVLKIIVKGFDFTKQTLKSKLANGVICQYEFDEKARHYFETDEVIVNDAVENIVQYIQKNDCIKKDEISNHTFEEVLRQYERIMDLQDSHELSNRQYFTLYNACDVIYKRVIGVDLRGFDIPQ